MSEAAFETFTDSNGKKGLSLDNGTTPKRFEEAVFSYLKENVRYPIN
mgnify:FL=1